MARGTQVPPREAAPQANRPQVTPGRMPGAAVSSDCGLAHSQHSRSRARCHDARSGDTTAARRPERTWSRAPPGQPVPIRPNVMLYVYGMNVSPEVIYIIRHAERALKQPLSGVDFEGGQHEHSLLPRGWQRSGALAALFHPGFGPVRAGLQTPTCLLYTSPSPRD